MTNNDTNKRTASQRLEDMESNLVTLYHTVDNMTRDLLVLRDAVKLLGNKLDAVVKATNAQEPLTDTVLTRIMLDNHVEELKERVKQLLDQGILVSEEQVTENSFVVGREVTESGTVVYPRVQFSLVGNPNLQPEVKAKIVGSKPGEILILAEDKLRLEILETYRIQSPVSSPVASADAQQSPNTVNV